MIVRKDKGIFLSWAEHPGTKPSPSSCASSHTVHVQPTAFRRSNTIAERAQGPSADFCWSPISSRPLSRTRPFHKHIYSTRPDRPAQRNRAIIAAILILRVPTSKAHSLLLASAAGCLASISRLTDHLPRTLHTTHPIRARAAHTARLVLTLPPVSHSLSVMNAVPQNPANQ